jgi:hypothetical protein
MTKIAGADFAGKNLSQKSGAKVKLVRLTFATRRGPDSAPLRTWCRFQEFRDKLIAPRNAKPRCRPLSEVPHGQALDTLLTCL